MQDLKPRIHENGMDYVLVGDYYVPDLKLPEQIGEDLKARDQMAWVRAMNSIRSRAEEIIKKEMIYC